VNIVDGDTIDVIISGVQYRVRYIGIDTPEVNEYYYYQAKAANANLVYGKTVLLIKDVSEVDRYDRLLRYVFIGDIFVNQVLVELGFAQANDYTPDTACSSTFNNAESFARSSLLGFWKPTPTSLPAGLLPLPTSSGNCDPSYPTICIPSPPPDLDCGDIPYNDFQVLPPDPHNFDGDDDGYGCES
jgi:micrococcal nuclease